jgi:Rad3-related DNA helicase
LDPSEIIRSSLERGAAAIFFSATLSPLNYFCEILGGTEEDFVLSVESPFDPANLQVIANTSISTKYLDRERSYGKIAYFLKEELSGLKGNYLVFFPSYTYMEEVLGIFSGIMENIQILVQEKEMDDSRREAFLEKFSMDNKGILLGFAVLGGIFSEGIDLKGDRLKGVVIISVGIPMISHKRDLIKQYFQRKNGQGYDFAYVFPGMSKVLQAAGRVIRTETDTGFVILIDSRYGEWKYRQLMPDFWRDVRYVEGA